MLDCEIESLERNRYRCEECVKLTQETFTEIIKTMKKVNSLEKERDEWKAWRASEIKAVEKQRLHTIVACRQAVWDVLGNDLHLIPAIEEAMDARVLATDRAWEQERKEGNGADT